MYKGEGQKGGWNVCIKSGVCGKLRDMYKNGGYV